MKEVKQILDKISDHSFMAAKKDNDLAPRIRRPVANSFPSLFRG